MADLADGEAGDRLVDRAWSVWGGLDAWLHIAGADTLTGEAARLPFDAKLDLLWQVNVLATMRLCRSVGRLMKASRRRIHRHDGLGPGGDGHGGGLGRAVRRDQGGRHGVHPQPGPEPGPDGPRQRPGAGLDQDGVGRKRLLRLAGACAP